MHEHVPSLTYDNLEVSSSILSFILSLFCIQAGRKKPKTFHEIEKIHIEGTCVCLPLSPYLVHAFTGTFHREMGGGGGR